MRELSSHVDRCPGCRAELALQMNSVETIRSIAAADLPTPLPADFAWQVQSRLGTRRRQLLVSGPGTRWRQVSWGYVAFGGVAALLYLATPANHQHTQLARAVPSRGSAEVRWDDRRFAGIPRPQPLKQWQPSGQPGIYAILQRPDADKKPDTYVMAFCGESQTGGSASSTWLHDLRRLLTAQAARPEEIYVVEYPMPGSTREQRQRVQRGVIRQLRPAFNQLTGV